MKTNEQVTSEVDSILDVVKARLYNLPQDSVDWRIIASQLRMASNVAETAAHRAEKRTS